MRGREQILLVEDDYSIQEGLTLFLNETYDVKCATTGAEALAILGNEDVDIVVLDYRLPDYAGLEVLTKIKSTQPSLPVIMITGYGSEELCASALRLGVRDYFPKPLNARDLLESVRRILAGASQTRERRDNVLAKGGRQARAPELSAGPPDLSLQNAIRLIQHRYWDQISLSELAREVGMSKYRLSRGFKKVMGVTFREYLTRVRLDKVQALLQATQYSITEVAQRVGFGDLPRFDKLFKRYTGLTPSDYRTQNLASGNK